MDIGLTWAGFDHIGFAEVDEYCRAVLAARWPGVHIYDDVHNVATADDDYIRPWLPRDGSWLVEGGSVHGDSDRSRGNQIRGGQDHRGGTSERGASERRPNKQPDLRRTDRPGPHSPGAELPEPGWERRPARIDLLCGGFPCQDISYAGKRAGLAGERSGLFWEFHRIAGTLRPRAVLIENVEGLLSSGTPRGSDLADILQAMADIGYALSWRLMDSQYLGVPQRRRRLFLAGIAVDDPAAGRLGEVLALTEGSVRDPAPRIPTWPGLAPRAGQGAESSRVGSGAGRVDQPVAFRKSRRAQSNEDAETWVDDGVANTLNTYDTGDVRTTHAVVSAFNVQPEFGNGADIRADETDIHPTLAKQTHLPGYDRGVRVVQEPVAFTQNQRDEVREMPLAGALPAQPGSKMQTFVREEGDVISPTLTSYNLDSRSPQSEEQQRVVAAVHEVTSIVRRLTPLECERLQGFPDGWTDIPWKNKDHSPDSRRYAACGNAVTSHAAYWIGSRFAQVLA